MTAAGVGFDGETTEVLLARTDRTASALLGLLLTRPGAGSSLIDDSRRALGAGVARIDVERVEAAAGTARLLAARLSEVERRARAAFDTGAGGA